MGALKSNEMSFKYSILFYLVLIIDILISFIFGFVIISSYFSISNNDLQTSFSLFLGLIFLINFIIDLFFLSNKWKTPNTINLRLCWIKCIFGFIGIFTLISGLYFFIISAKMSYSRNKTGIYENKKPKFCQKCFSELKNENSTFCTNCGANLIERKNQISLDENLKQVQQTEKIQKIPEKVLPKGISESGYHQNKTEKVIISQKNTKKSISGSINWAGTNQSIVVHGYTIKNPLAYWSDGPCLPQEASCIDRNLPVEKPGFSAYPLPYYPRYSDLNPVQRGKYLSWLSSGRNDNLDEIGYAFIYFYGLEHRGLIEKEDTEKILDEARRLLTRYPSSNSFNSYVNHFIAYIVGSQINEREDPAFFKYFSTLDNLDWNSTSVILAWYWKKNKPIPWELGYSLSKNLRSLPKSNIVKKNPDLVKLLFKEKFQNFFPQGIPFNPDYSQVQIEYRPASPSILSYIGYSKEPNRIEPLMLRIPPTGSEHFKILFKIWVECIEVLTPACNKLNKTGGKITKEVYSQLPSELKSGMMHPDMELWQQCIASKRPVKGLTIAQISELAVLLGIEERETLTAMQSRMISSTAEDMRFIIVPDQKISGTSFKWKDSVAIIPIPDKNTQISEKFQQAALIFELAYSIAASDETVSEIEENFLHKFISEQFRLNALEIECLRGLQQVLEIRPPSLSRIGKRLSKHLNSEQKIVIANFLSDIVLLDNKFVKSEQKALKTVFKSLEIDSSVSDELIKKLLIGQIPEEPITILKPGKARKGEVIPSQVITTEFCINKEKLKQTMEDTRAVQEILASVFEQEQEEIVIDIEPEVKIPESPVKTNSTPKEFDLPFPSETIPTLDTKYLSMLHDIMKSNEMSQDEFTSLARKHNLMPRAAFDDINTWADEELGDFLLEESESHIVINYKK